MQYPTTSLALVTLHADPISPPGIFGGGGTHLYINEIASSLISKGWHVSIITRRVSSKLPPYQKICELADLFRIEVGGIGELDKTQLNSLHSESLERSLELIRSFTLKPSIIHSVYWNSGRVAKDLSQKLGIRFVHTVISNGQRMINQGISVRDPERTQVERTVYHAASHIFCICNQEKLDLIQLYDVLPDKISVVGRPVGSCFHAPARNDLGIPNLNHSLIPDFKEPE